MNEYNLKVNFEKGQIITNLKKLVQNDYNTTKLNFTFDKEGRVLFKMSYPDGTQYVDEIKNNELIFGKGVLNQEDTYEYEIALYTEDGRLTNHAIGKFEVRSELVNTDEIVEVDDRVPVLDNLISEVNIIKQDVADGKYNGKDGADGTDGQNGVTPTIGENGNWFIGDVDTGLPSQGPEGKPGPAGGVTLEEVTAITGDPQKLETESKQLVGAINEVLNNSGGSGIYEIETNSVFSNGKVGISEALAKETMGKAITEMVINNKTLIVSLKINGEVNPYIIRGCRGSETKYSSYTMTGIRLQTANKFNLERFCFKGSWSDNVFTCTEIYKEANYSSTFDKDTLATKTYVNDAITNAITTVLAGEY